MKEDIRIKYEQVIEQFDVPELMAAGLIATDAAPDTRLTAPMVFTNVSFGEDNGPKILDGVSCTLPLDGHTAIVGGAGRDEFAMLAARLLMPTAGRIRIGEQDLVHMPEAVTGRRIAYVGQNSYMFTASLRDNLYYGLRHRPLAVHEGDERSAAEHRRRSSEARAAGNTDFRWTRTGSTMSPPAATAPRACAGARSPCWTWWIWRTTSTGWALTARWRKAATGTWSRASWRRGRR